MDALQRQVLEVELHGFTVVQDVLSPDEVAAIRAVNERLLAERDEDMDFNGRAGHVSNLPPLDPVYLPLIDHPGILPLLEAVMLARGRRQPHQPQPPRALRPLPHQRLDALPGRPAPGLPARSVRLPQTSARRS